jgi:hypothetical protein
VEEEEEEEGAARPWPSPKSLRSLVLTLMLTMMIVVMIVVTAVEVSTAAGAAQQRRARWLAFALASVCSITANKGNNGWMRLSVESTFRTALLRFNATTVQKTTRQTQRSFAMPSSNLRVIMCLM